MKLRAVPQIGSQVAAVVPGGEAREVLVALLSAAGVRPVPQAESAQAPVTWPRQPPSALSRLVGPRSHGCSPEPPHLAWPPTRKLCTWSPQSGPPLSGLTRRATLNAALSEARQLGWSLSSTPKVPDGQRSVRPSPFRQGTEGRVEQPHGCGLGSPQPPASGVFPNTEPHSTAFFFFFGKKKMTFSNHFETLL